MKFRIPNQWRPRDYQLPLWRYLQNGGKRAVAVWHRRAGKDDLFLHWAARCTMVRPATYWHMLPEATQARKAIWEAVNPHTGKRRIDEAFPHEIRETTRENEMMIKFKKGATWQVVGSDNYNSLVGSPPVGVLFSEWPLAKPQAWGFLRPILLENNGWAAFIYTPRGYNHGHDLYQTARSEPGWFAETLTVDDTGVFTPKQLADELREMQKDWGKEQGEALFRQEYYCSFDAAIIGSVYGQWIERIESEGRVKFDSIWEKDSPVHTAWDIGRTDATSVWFFQVIGQEVRVIDFYENRLQDPPHYAEMVKDKPYQYGTHFGPHDMTYKLFAAGGRSMVQWFFELGLTFRVVSSTSVQNSITAARKVFDNLWIDKTKCRIGYEHLRQYHYRFNENKHNFDPAPVHDQHSHAANAFEILARVYKIDIIPTEKTGPRFLHEATANDLFWPTGLHSPPQRI